MDPVRPERSARSARSRRTASGASPRKFRAAAVDAGQPLGAWLAARLDIALAAATALVTRGSVYIDGRRARDPRHLLAAGQRVVAHDAPETEVAPAPAWRVAFQDASVLVIDKPAGLAVQATRAAAGALDEQVAARFPGAAPMHRLDRDASGLVLFARTAEARARLQGAFEAGEVGRAYVAFAAGHLAQAELVLDAPIAGRRALTRVRVVRRGVDASGAAACELAVTIETGRTHQIRIHLARAGHPLLGDARYAPPEVAARAPRLALHATRLRWPGGESSSPLPADLGIILRP